MDKYKKKSLKFMGLAREVRTLELHSARTASRNQRFSLLRTIANEDDPETPKPKEEESTSKIPMFGKPRTEGSRFGMLQKWKEEKLLKKQKELKIQKPTFKVGIIKHNPPPILTTTHLSKDPNLSKTQNTTKNSGYKFRVGTHDSKDVKNKDSRLQPSFNKSRPVSSNLATKSKSGVSQPVIKKPDFGIKLPNKNPASGLSKPVQVQQRSKITGQETNKNSFVKRNMAPIGSVAMKAVSQKNPPIGTLKPVDSRLQNKVNSQNPAIGTLRPVDSRLQNKVNGQIPSIRAVRPIDSRLQTKTIVQNSSIPKNNVSKTTGRLPQINGRSLLQPAPSRIGRGVLKPPSASVPVKQANNSHKVEVSSEQTRPTKAASPAKEDDSESTVESKDNIFKCEISFIEPVNAHEKSFAPKGFLFCPPIEMNSSLYLESYAPSTVTTRVKNEAGRTSTPKQPDLSESETKISTEEKGIDKNEIPDWSEMSCHTKEPNLHPESEGNVDCKLSLNFQSDCNDSSLDKAADSPSPSKPGARTVLREINSLECEPNKLESKVDPVEKAAKENSLKDDFVNKQFTFSSPTIVGAEPKLDVTPPKEEDSVFLPPAIVPEIPDLPKISTAEDKFLNPVCVTQKGEVTMRTRSFRRSERPKVLERINESPENSTPKSHKKGSLFIQEFTPRRSLRLAKMRESSSLENLLDVGRPSIFATPENGKSSASASSKLTYDFERLHLESENEAPSLPAKTSARLSTAQARKISLLYTPPRRGRSSVARNSIKGDLMSFSPSA